MVHGERGRLYGTPNRRLMEAAAVGRYQWGAAPTEELPRVDVPRPAQPTPAQWREVRRRAWAWRLLLVAWLLLMALVGYVGTVAAGAGSLCCLLPMAAVLLALAWVASADVRERERSLRAGGR